MTEKEVIAIKKYCEGAYPQMKSNDDSDLVWYDMLKNEEYYGILQSVKNYIRNGNKFPPSLAELIKGYELIIHDFNNEVLRLMDEDGYFNDPQDSDIEISSWNKEQRKRKALVWISSSFPKEAIPKWFKEDYQKYERMIKAKYFALSPRNNNVVRALS